jgi:hypothetical protein
MTNKLHKHIVEQAGYRYDGTSEGLVWFTDLETKSTGAYPAEQITVERLKAHRIAQKKRYHNSTYPSIS